MKEYEIFFKDTFNVLLYMYESMDKNETVRVTQEEIADGLGLSKPTVYRCIKQLKDADFVSVVGDKTGRYLLSQKALKFINCIKKVL